MEVSFFQSFTSKRPLSSTLEAVAAMIKGNERVKAITESYRVTRDKAVKASSPLFGVAARFEGGKNKGDICRLTGLSMVDIDHVNTYVVGDKIKNEKVKNERVKNEKLGLLEALRARAVADPHTVMCYRTISGEGLRVIFRYELEAAYSLEQQMQWYPKAFAAGNAYYAQLLGVATDGKCKNIGRLSGLAHDAEVYLNMDAVAFTAAEVEETARQVQQAQRAEAQRRRERTRLERAYERMIRPEVEADGAVYAPGSHNDYVMRVGYKLCKLRFNEELAVAWALEMFPEYEETEAVIRACYRRGLSPDPSPVREGRSGVREGSSVGREGGKWAGVEDIRAFLSGHIELRHNVITGRVEAKTDAVWLPITDRLVNSLWAEMARTQKVNVQDIYRVIESDFVPEYQPFEAYLKALPLSPPVKEGSELREEAYSAIAALARTVKVKGGTEEQALWEEYLRKWLVGMVAGWVGQNEVNHVILVLIGEQGSYKTTWFQYLLPPELRRYFYTKTNANRMGRDDLLTLAQYGLVCCEELDTMRPAELNQLKAAVTMSSIDERAAYAHFHEHRKHIASFCGTGNNIQFLSDPTGNRRWLPFEVESIRSPREQPFDYARIYAEAYSLYLSGFNYWFSREEIVRLSEHNRQFETPRLERELVQQYFRVPTPGEKGEFMPVALALQVISGNISQKLSAILVGRAFKEQGFACKKVKNVRGYIVVRYTAQEMQARRDLAATL